ncbi:Replication factor A, C-terminal [Dillenia turbinata]|uniref:Replication factor A, C-terminal n=1 Tax=Dillenia turbinata TaxID=194707 RepID=A0AAN8UUH3_9MAGN
MNINKDKHLSTSIRTSVHEVSAETSNNPRHTGMPGVSLLMTKIDNRLLSVGVPLNSTRVSELSHNMNALVPSFIPSTAAVPDEPSSFVHSCNATSSSVALDMSFLCNSCRERATAKPRYCFNIDLEDDTGKITASVFGDLAEKLLTFTGVQAMKHLNQNIELPLQLVHQTLREKVFVAHIRPVQSKATDVKQCFTIIYYCDASEYQINENDFSLSESATIASHPLEEWTFALNDNLYQDASEEYLEANLIKEHHALLVRHRGNLIFDEISRFVHHFLNSERTPTIILKMGTHSIEVRIQQGHFKKKRKDFVTVHNLQHKDILVFLPEAETIFYVIIFDANGEEKIFPWYHVFPLY